MSCPGGGTVRYYQGADGRRYCWDMRQRYRCPFAGGDLSEQQELEAAAGAAGLNLSEALARLHKEASPDRYGGRPCPYCGSELQRLGWAAWVAEESGRPSRPIGERFYLEYEGAARAWAKEQAQGAGEQE